MTMANETPKDCDDAEPNTTSVEETTHDGTENDSSQEDDRGMTFRKRRLSVTKRKQISNTAGTTELVEDQEYQRLMNDGEEEEDDDNDDNKNETSESTAAATETATATAIPAAKATTAAATTAAKAQEGEEDEKAQTFRKRRLSLTHSREESSDQSEMEPPSNRRRRESDASIASVSSAAINSNNNNPLQSRIVHSSELLTNNPPLSPANDLPRLYETSAPPQQQSVLSWDESNLSSPAPKWKKRHTHDDERTLPFPRDVVGTFSCHGVEPIYDSDYKPEDDDDDDEDYDAEESEDDHQAGWGSSVTSKKKKTTDATIQDGKVRPTTAAKINQDRGGVAFPYGNCSRTALFAAYDGHGQGGELVSQFALHEVQRRLEKHPNFSDDIQKAFKETFLAVDKALTHEALIEPRYAGTTACVALLRQDQLIVSNVGDSRAVLARRCTNSNGDGNGSDEIWQAIDLSVDQNPDLPEEQSRIERMGGFVSPPPEPGLSARVWLDVTCTQIGLAMSRSIGDHAVKEVGVIAEPVVTTHQVTEQDDFVIIATDGVWEFISSDQAVQIVSENLYRGATRACQALIEAAAARWHSEEGDYRDDITAFVIRLQHLWKHAPKCNQKDTKAN